MKKRLLSTALVALIAFGQPVTGGSVAQIVSPLSNPDHPLLPKDARADQCFAHEVTPAILETTTEKTQLTPPRLAVDIETGKTEVIRPATYNIVTVQRVIRERQELFFETICPQLYTERFVQSLQRALSVRGFYDGAPSGWLDDETAAAIRRYQKTQGLPSSILSLRTVEAFGLVSHRDFKGLSGN